MKCTSCGNEIMNYDQVCPYCGKPQQSAQQGNAYPYGNPYQQPGVQNAPAGAQYGQNPYSQGYAVPDAEKRNNRFMLVIAGVAALLIVLGCLLFAIVHKTAEKVREDQAIAAESSQEESSKKRIDRMLEMDDITAVAEDTTSEDLILPGLKRGTSAADISQALRQTYPELTFRKEDEENVDWVSTSVYYSTNGDQKISLYGVSEKAVLIVGFTSDDKACFGRLYFGDVYGKEPDGTPLIYCGSTAAKNRKMYSQLKASLDEKFGEGKYWSDGDEEIKSAYQYNLDGQSSLLLKCRESFGQDGETMLYDTMLEYYWDQ